MYTVQGGQEKSVSLLAVISQKMVKDANMKLRNLKEIVWQIIWYPIYEKVSIELLLSSFKNGLCATLFAHVLEVGTTTLKAHLNALQVQ